MKLVLAGLRFTVSPSEKLTEKESQALSRLARFETSALGEQAFQLELVDSPPWVSDDPAHFPVREPAVVRCERERVCVSHASFVGEVEPLLNRGRLHRRTAGAFPLEACLRVALSCRLPLEGGLPLHAAGLAVEGKGLVFFGPSGAGKSTLAERSPYPVLSDEVVAITPGPNGFQLRPTGFWGALEPGEEQKAVLPLAALLSLEKGADFLLEPLPKKEAFRRFLEVLQVPFASWLWSPAMEVLNRLVSEVPVYRMAWSPARPPWPELQELWQGSP